MARYNTGASASGDGYLTLGEIFSLATIAARYDPAKAYSYARQPLEEQLDSVTKRGQTLHIELEPTLTTVSVTAATGAATAIAPYFTQKDLTFDQHESVPLEMTWRAGRSQQVFDPLEKLAPKQVDALAAKANSFFVGKFDDYLTTNTIGTSAAISPSVGVLNQAIKLLKNYNIDAAGAHSGECVFVLPSEAEEILWADESFRDSCVTGSGNGGYRMSKIKMFRDIPIVFTTACASGTYGKIGALFHRDALLFGIQAMNSYKEKVDGAEADRQSLSWLYGAAAGVETQGVRIDLAC